MSALGGPTPITRRGFAIAGGLGAAGVTVGPASASPSDRRHPRRSRMPRLTMTKGGTVQRRGKDFRAGGVNAFQLITNDYPSPRLMSPIEIDTLLAKAIALEAKVVRAHTLAASVGNPHTLVTGVSGTGPHPTITYDPAVWDVIDYAVWKADRLGVYLIAPFVDELGWFHGGKRHWVNFRRPGSVSLDPTVKAATSPAQRAAENAFYQDQQITWDFERYIRDWLEHVNPRTGRAYKDEPALSVVQVGNELWTAAQDAPGWVATKAALIKKISPTTLVMDSGADGLAVESMAWGSKNVDILEAHPYSTFGAHDVRRMARFAQKHGKAFAVGEYPWSKSTAPAIERAVRRGGNVFTSALWSLQNDQDLHNFGAGYGGDDAAFYLPGKDAVQLAAAQRIKAHHRALERRAAL